MPASVAGEFELGGGTFLTPADHILERLQRIEGFVFDWDGVFNPGLKGEGAPSPFSELDSMGTNLLRFGWWLRAAGRLPLTAILTGQENPTAQWLAERERFQAVYSGFLDKGRALDHMKLHFRLTPDRIAYFFDDVLDLSVASRCGLRIMARSRGAPLLGRLVRERGLADYVTGAAGGSGAVREAAELLLGLAGLYEKAVDERTACSPVYTSYLTDRNAADTSVFRPEQAQAGP